MDTIFQGLFDSAATTLNVTDFLTCVATALVIGIIIAFVYTYKSRYTRSFVVTLVMLPAIVSVVIMMVNGNIGAGVAVAGAFSLVRFRSVPGTAKEIGTIFLAMGTGLVCGMGYLGYAVLFTLIMAGVMALTMASGIGGHKAASRDRRMQITVPEDLDYTTIFDDVLDTYTTDHELVRAKTTAMGSLFKLTYDITFRDTAKEKEFIDLLRCRNGNLEISITRQGGEADAL